MTELYRIPVVAPNGKRLVLVVDGNYFEGMDGDFLVENIPIEAIVAVEDCPEGVTPVAAAGWKPESTDGILSSDRSDSDPRPLSH